MPPGCHRRRTVRARDDGYLSLIDLVVKAVESAEVTKTPMPIGNLDDNTHQNLPIATGAILLSQAEQALGLKATRVVTADGR